MALKWRRRMVPRSAISRQAYHPWRSRPRRSAVSRMEGAPAVIRLTLKASAGEPNAHLASSRCPSPDVGGVVPAGACPGRSSPWRRASAGCATPFLRPSRELAAGRMNTRFLRRGRGMADRDQPWLLRPRGCPPPFSSSPARRPGFAASHDRPPASLPALPTTCLLVGLGLLRGTRCSRSRTDGWIPT